MFGNQGEDVLILFSGTPWGRFCSEGRKHSIVNGQSFRLPIESRPKNLSEMFHTILGYSRERTVLCQQREDRATQTFVSQLGEQSTHTKVDS